MKNTFKQRFLEFVLAHCSFLPQEKVLVAVSGGMDSMVLLHLLLNCRRRLRISLGVVHLHHGIRRESAEADLRLVRSFCQESNLPFHLLKRSVPRYAREHKLSIEEAGHLLRQELFTALAGREGYHKIATAHHGDDQAETVLMRLISGTGLSGLAATRLQIRNWVRPLLFATRQEIEEYGVTHRIPFAVDETNRDISLLRNRIRHQLLPLLTREYNPRIARHLVRLSEIAGEWEDYLEIQATQAMHSHVLRVSENKFEVGLPAFTLYFSGILVRIIGIILQKLGENEWQVSYEQYTHFRRWMDTGKIGSKYQWSNRVFAFKGRDRISWVTEREPGSSSRSVKIEAEAWYPLPDSTIKIMVSNTSRDKITFTPDREDEYISGDHLQFPLLARKWKAGDRFIPLGMDQPKLVSDFLTDLKVDRPEKNAVMVLLNDQEIVAVLGYRISQYYRIGANTKRIYQLKLRIGK